MAELNSSICISSVCSTILEMAGVKAPDGIDVPNPVLSALKDKKLGDGNVDRVVIYNPDAVALWVFQKYTDMFTKAMLSSDIAIPMLSVMPSVTPVCFASMYTGVMPDEHGIKRYEKPILKCRTIFDDYVAAGKKVAIVSTENDSISRIFLEREIEYFLYETPEEVNKKALELIDEDRFDFIVIYNGNYDGEMHEYTPEGEESLNALKMNIDYYDELVNKIKSQWTNHKTFYGFCPDHGCHETEDGGAHGLDIEEDMNVIHFYGIA